MPKNLCNCGVEKDVRAKNCVKCYYKLKKGKPWTGGRCTPEQYKEKGLKRQGFKQNEEWIKKRMISRYGYDIRNEDIEPCDVTRWHLKTWASAVKKIYDNKCAWCGTDKNIHAHHIIPRYITKEYQLCISNGIALCHEHHWELHNKLGEV